MDLAEKVWRGEWMSKGNEEVEGSCIWMQGKMNWNRKCNREYY